MLTVLACDLFSGSRFMCPSSMNASRFLHVRIDERPQECNDMLLLLTL